jgi:signal transduction histidine kinase
VVVLAGLTSDAVVRQRGHDGWGTPLLALLLLAPLAWRRRAPLPTFALIAGAAFVQWLAGPVLLADVALLIALYTVVTLCPRRVATVAVAVIEVGALLAATKWSATSQWPQAFVFLSGMVAAALFLGVNVRNRRARLAWLTERADRLELERDQQTTIAAAAERTRIAREMHDIVAHSLSVMVTLADGAALKQAADPAQAAAAVQQVSATGRQALGDMRRLLGVLRTDDLGGDRQPQPDVHQIDQLVAQVRSTGLAAELAITGAPPTLSPGAEVTVYRIVQEALTNTLKHASGATRVRIALRYGHHSIEVDVRDNGEPAVGEEASGGHGLTGMRERAAAFGGWVQAGPDPAGGWHVHVDLPLDTAGSAASTGHRAP